ncbi:hypothetical protein ADL21_11210 [Streptomyces albus subsp. albus]|nr:hypothetical protein ADL21_11210 [Streptomyces albus subsp. albus]
MPLRVLSVRQPWAWAILHAGKDVENRSWSTDHRGPIAIQAARTPAAGGREQLRAMGIDVPTELPVGVILGVVDLLAVVRDADSRWTSRDCWHWRLACPRPLVEPVPLSGRQGLFTAPADAVARVREQLPGLDV